MIVNIERVELVRKRMGLNKGEFALALGLDRTTVQRALFVQGNVGADLLAKLVEISGYPKAFFAKGDPDPLDESGVSFRSLRSLTARPREAALAAAVIAFELDDWVRSRVELPQHSIPKMPGYHPREAALALRAQWGIGIRPIANMVNVLESHGVRVFSLVEETRHLDAYAYWRNDAPYIFLNTCKTGEHSRFDSAHELAHLTMHRHGGTNRRDAEHEANTFASEFLMPQADLLASASKVQTLSDIIKAKHRWGVSAAALNYALHEVEIIRDWQYRNNCIEMNRVGRSNEPEPCGHETSQVWAKVLTAFWQRGITLSHIAHDLEIPESEITKLLFNIAGPARAVGRVKPQLALI